MVFLMVLCLIILNKLNNINMLSMYLKPVGNFKKVTFLSMSGLFTLGIAV